MLHTEVAVRGAASKGLYRIPQKFWFLASHASSIKHPSPHWAQCSLVKWNVPEAADWSHSCLIFISTCSVGRFTSLTQSTTQGVPATTINTTFCLAPNSPIPKSEPHLKHFPLTGVYLQQYREQVARSFWKWKSDMHFPLSLETSYRTPPGKPLKPKYLAREDKSTALITYVTQQSYLPAVIQSVPSHRYFGVQTHEEKKKDKWRGGTISSLQKGCWCSEQLQP